MNKVFPVLIIALFTLTACGKKEAEPIVAPLPKEVEATSEVPVFNTDIDDDSAFDAALGSVPSDQTPQFVEVIDDIDADSIQAAEVGEKMALESEEDKAARAKSEARGVARKQVKDLNTALGLEFRPYSADLYAQIKGVKPAIIYFTSDDCEKCGDWEATLRSQASDFSDKNALILMADFDEEATLVSEMGIKEAGWAMMLTGMGELMGPRPTERLTKEDLGFIFQ